MSMYFDDITEKKKISKEDAIAILDDLVVVTSEANKFYTRGKEASIASIESLETTQSLKYQAENSYKDLREQVTTFIDFSNEMERIENKRKKRSKFVSGLRAKVGLKQLEDSIYNALKEENEKLNVAIHGNTDTTSFSPLTYYMATCQAANVAPDKVVSDEYNRRTSSSCPDNEKMADMRGVNNIHSHKQRVSSLGDQIKYQYENLLSSSKSALETATSGVKNTTAMTGIVSRVKSAILSSEGEKQEALLDEFAKNICKRGVLLSGHEVPYMYVSLDDTISVKDREVRVSEYMAENAHTNCNYSNIFINDIVGIMAGFNEMHNMIGLEQSNVPKLDLKP